MAPKANQPLLLPVTVTGRTDIVRLTRELEQLEACLHEAALRKQPAAKISLPSSSRMLDEFAKLNGLNLLHRADHDKAQAGLADIRQHAPQLHISFSAEPSAAFLGRLVDWLRQNIHPATLVQVGLQPGIAAGCVLRTPNKQFDLSLRQNFARQRGLLARQLAHMGQADER